VAVGRDRVTDGARTLRDAKKAGKSESKGERVAARPWVRRQPRKIADAFIADFRGEIIINLFGV